MLENSFIKLLNWGHTLTSMPFF